MWPQFANMLSPWQWLALGAVPPAILALYFLKLRREPLEVPSTYLWHKSIEDLRVNSLWQRLRQSILLLLQVLLILLLMLALLGPSWRGDKLTGNRFIFLLDNSGSMNSTDVDGGRLAEAKRRAAELIDEMKSGDEAMIVSFADGARVEQTYSQNRSELRGRVEQIQPTNEGTSLSEALRVASVLANPGRSAAEISDFQVAEAMPASLIFLSDGRFGSVADFSLGNLSPVEPVWIGKPDAKNVGVVAFGTARKEGSSGALQAFGRLQNFGLEPTSVTAELLIDGELADAKRLEIPAEEGRGVAFELGELRSATLELRIAEADDLALDNRAWAIVRPPQRSRVLFVTPGNAPLEFAFRTERAIELAQIDQHTPEFLQTDEYRRAAAEGQYDLAIYDRCAPEEMPRANTLFIGRAPAGGGWEFGEAVAVPQVIDTDRAHPLMQFVGLGDVLFVEARPLTGPAGTTSLIDSTKGTLAAIAPREGYEDLVLGFELVGDESPGTNWPVRPSFPVFVLNCLQYLTGAAESQLADSARPGDTIALRGKKNNDRMQVVMPDGQTAEVHRGKQNVYYFSGADQVGVYQVKEDGEVIDRVAVNPFSTQESDIRTRPESTFEIGNVEVESRSQWEPGRRAAWKYALAVALAVLVFEWYIYNRRAYL